MKLAASVLVLCAIVQLTDAFMCMNGKPTAAASERALSRASVLQAAASTAFAVAVAPAAQAAPLPAVGSQAPGFSLPSNDNGKTYTLEDFTKTGKTTVLYLYPGDFTSGCTIEAKAFQRDLEQYKALNAQVVGMSVDALEKHLDFQKKYGLDYPLLSDKDAVVADLYGSKLDIPFMGKFANRYTYVIAPTGKIEKVFTDVEGHVARHSTEVLDYLRSRA